MEDKLILNEEVTENEKSFFDEVIGIIQQGRTKAYRAINNSMLETYWRLGKRIVEQEQQGKERAEYGEGVLQRLSVELNKKFGKGYGISNLKYYRQFFLTFSDTAIRHTVCGELQDAENKKDVEHSALFDILDNESNQQMAIWRTPCAKFDLTLFSQLSWSHIRSIMRVNDLSARLWYLKESVEQTWSVRTLDRNIGSQYYERMLLSQHKDLVKNEMLEKTASLQSEKLEFIKNPVVVEFLGMSVITDFTETDLEKAIISNIQNFLMELGKGFAFVKRQQHIRTEEKDYYIDLVFYNYILKSFVIIDLKTTQISYQDVGQMDMYVQMYDKLKRAENDNPTIGIVLCSETDSDVARYSILSKSDQLFASKYKLYMPTEEELRREIERQKEFFRLQQNDKDEIK
jgi:predicted nuclease of restriction endonuclease-like (RecB) superfamily